MNDLIEKILKADEEARRVSHAVEEKRANLEAEISKEKAKFINPKYSINSQKFSHYKL